MGRSVKLDVTATYAELMAEAAPSALAPVQHEEILDGTASWQWMRDGLATVAAASGAGGGEGAAKARFVETIFLDCGHPVSWLYCDAAGIVRARSTPPPAEDGSPKVSLWPKIFQCLSGTRLDHARACKPRHETLERAVGYVAFASDERGGVKRYGLTRHELELLCCFEHAAAVGDATLKSWDTQSTRATSVRRILIALQIYAPPPLRCRGMGVFVHSFARARPRPRMTSVEIRLQVCGAAYEDPPEGFLPGCVKRSDEGGRAVYRSRHGSGDEGSVASMDSIATVESTLYQTAETSVIGSILGGDANELRDSGLATLVGGDYRRRLAEATTDLVALLQVAQGRTITRMTCDWIFDGHRTPYLLCCRGLGVLRVHRPSLGQRPPPSAVPRSLFDADGALLRPRTSADHRYAAPRSRFRNAAESSDASRSSRSSRGSRRRAEASRPHGFWVAPGQWPQTRSSEAHFDALVLADVTARNRPPKHAPPRARPRYALEHAILPKGHPSKREMWVGDHGAVLEDPHAIRTEERAETARLGRTCDDALVLETRLDALQGELHSTLKRSLSSSLRRTGVAAPEEARWGRNSSPQIVYHPNEEAHADSHYEARGLQRHRADASTVASGATGESLFL